MSENVKNLIEYKGDQVFSNLIDAVFELCVEFKDKINNQKTLTDAEIGLIEAMNEYVFYELEQQENENEES